MKVDYKLDSPKEIAEAINIKLALDLSGGMIVANPIPKQYEMEFSTIESTIQIALKEANVQGIKGKDITPFLLAKIESLTKGLSLKANIQLVLNNAKLAAEIGCELK